MFILAEYVPFALHCRLNDLNETRVLQPTVCIGEGQGLHCLSRPVEMLFRIVMLKLTKSSLERVQPITAADMLLLHKFQSPALTFANALLAAHPFLRSSATYFFVAVWSFAAPVNLIT